MTNLAGVLLLIGGCAGLAPRTEGTSGPLEWRVTGLRVEMREIQGEMREIQGKPVAGRAFVLVIKNISERTLTVTTMRESSYQPGAGSGFAT